MFPSCKAIDIFHSGVEEEDEDGNSGQQCQEALVLVEAALDEYPHNFDLLYVKALIEERCIGGEAALVTAKHMMALWKSLYEEASASTTSASESAYNTIQAGGHLSHSYSSYDTRSVALSAVSAQHVSNDPNEREGNCD